MKKESVIENFMVFLFVLLLLPFPKIAEEILVGSIFILCFIYCFFVSLKFIKKRNIDRKYICSLFYFLLFKSAKMCQSCL